jgi:hypothetical protein
MLHLLHTVHVHLKQDVSLTHVQNTVRTSQKTHCLHYKDENIEFLNVKLDGTYTGGRDSSVGIVTCYAPDGPGIEFR